jgi:hypothetical protein
MFTYRTNKKSDGKSKHLYQLTSYIYSVAPILHIYHWATPLVCKAHCELGGVASASDPYLTWYWTSFLMTPIPHLLQNDPLFLFPLHSADPFESAVCSPRMTMPVLLIWLRYYRTRKLKSLSVASLIRRLHYSVRNASMLSFWLRWREVGGEELRRPWRGCFRRWPTWRSGQCWLADVWAIVWIKKKVWTFMTYMYNLSTLRGSSAQL